MAERRMFTKKITDSDPFTEMPLSAQALYFHLNMNADDDGFLNNPKKIQRSIGASEDDMKLLIAKRFILTFEKGVIVIKHWRMHNLLRKDRYTETQYIDEKDTLMLQKDGSYTEKPLELPVATIWQPNGNQMATQYSIGKDSTELDKESIDNTPPAPPSDTVSHEFEELWFRYPRKEGKKAAFASYQRARKKGVTYEDVHAGVLNYLDYIKAKKIEPQFIKQGSTWFNGEHWNDEYDYSVPENTPTQQVSDNPFLNILRNGEKE